MPLMAPGQDLLSGDRLGARPRGADLFDHGGDRLMTGALLCRQWGYRFTNVFIQHRGEPLAALWAAEGAIYQRFGFGMATASVNLEADVRAIR